MYLPERVTEVCRAAGRWAADPDLSFDWRDMAKLADAIRAKNP